MATSSKYFVLPSVGANFIDFDLSYGTVSLQGQEIVFVGSTLVDAIFVRPGVTVDFTLSGTGADKIYLSGNLGDYSTSLSGSIMTLTRGSGDTLETVKFVRAPQGVGASDQLIFADGSLSSFDLYAHINPLTQTPLPALNPAETSAAPLAPAATGSVLNAGIKAFSLDANGETFAMARHGIALTVVGSVGVDKVYVPDGGTVDATLLGGGTDQVYFRGNWGDYSKTVAGSFVTFTRSVDGMTESVKVVASTGNSNDLLVFADGAVLSNNAKLAINANASVAISGVTGYDANTTTPGIDTTPPNLTVTAVGDGNLTAAEATAAGGVVSVTTEADASVTVVFTGTGGQVSKTLTGTGAAQAVVLDANDLLALGEGAVSVATTATDAAGNSTTASSGGFTLDTHAPEITVAAVGDGDLTAAEATAGVVTVNAEDGASVSVVFTGSGGGQVTKTLTGNGGDQTIALSGSDIASLGDGAVTVASTATDVAGNVSTDTEGGFNLDTVAPVYVADSAQVDGATLTLSYDEVNGLDATHTANPGDFIVTVTRLSDSSVTHPAVTAVAVNGGTVTLTLDTPVAYKSTVTLAYVDSSSGVNAIQDVAGNDAAAFSDLNVLVPNGILADGYIRDAHIYIDTNGDGEWDHDTGTTTNASGNFFLPPGTPDGTIIAIGGVNIDTGVPNTIVYKAPAGSTTVSPLTTLVQTYVQANGGTAESAASAVQTALGLPAGVDLLTFDPLAAAPDDADAVAVQKAAAQIATIAMLAASAPASGATAASAGQEVINNLVTTVTGAGAGSVNLSDSGTATGLLGASTSVSSTAVSDATAAIGGASTFSQISGAQSVALDTIFPAAPLAIPDLVATSDTGRLNNDDITHDNTPTVRVRLNTSAVDGTAAVAGDTAKVHDGVTLVGSGVITANDIANGFIDITTSSLSDSIHSLTANITDVAGNVGPASSALSVSIDTVAPTSSVSGIALSSDTGISAGDFITKVATQIVTATLSAPLAAGERLYGSTNGGATWSDISAIPGSISGTSVAWNTALRAGTNTLQFKISDTAGNDGPLASQAYSLDTAAPGLTVAGVGDGNLSAAEATGAGGVVTINAETGSSVAVVFTGSSGSVTKTFTGDASAHAVALSAGDLSTLGNGAVSVATTATDLAGNARLSLAGGFTLDASAPPAPVIGTVASDNLVNAAEKTAGVAVSGTAEVGAIVAVTWGTTTKTVTATAGAWTTSFTSGEIPVDGSSTVSARATDAAGNLGAAGTRAVTVDTSAPAAPIVTPADTTIIDHGGSLYLNNGQFDVSGLEAGATWQYTLNGGTTWLNGTGTSFTLSNGTYGAEVQVRQIDATGNPGTPDINDGTVIVDTTKPAALGLALAADTGASAGDGITSNGQFNITGLEADATWQYSSDGADTWSTGSGTSFTLTPGSYAAGMVKVRQTDVAGNYGSLTSSSASIVIDATAPAFQSATVNGTSLVLNYSEALDAANTAAIGAFAVSVNGVGRGVSAVAVSGNTVTLTLASAVANGETVSVSYTDPTAGNDTNANQDAAGNDAISLTAQSVTNTTPAIPTNDAPVFWMLNDGRVLAGIEGYDINASDLLLQGDGKIVVPGAINDNNPSNFNFSVLRFGADGRLDTSFNSDGITSTAIAATYDAAMGGVIQADGKILVAGQVINGGTNYDFALVRYNADGSLDTGFGTNGITITAISANLTNDNDMALSIALQADGKPVVSGFSQGVTGDGSSKTAVSVVRYGENGSLDTTFDGDGKVTNITASGSSNSGNVVEALASGKILVGGYAFNTANDFTLWRFNSNGSIDTTFGSSGVVETDMGGSDSMVDLAVLADGKIVVAGNANVAGATGDIALARYSANGVLDTTFGGSGKVVVDLGLKETVSSLAVQADGKLLVAGIRDVGGTTATDDFFVMRLNADGSQDSTFGSNGLVSLPFTSTAFGSTSVSGAYLEVQSDGKLLLAGGVAGTLSGSQRVALARFNADGSLDTNFGAVAQYKEGSAAIVLDGDVAIFDAELTPTDNFNGASLTLARHGGASAQDVFTASGTLGALSTGAGLSVGGTTIGTVTGNANGSLQLTFNAAATQTLVNKAMQQIAYSNTSTTPPASVQIDWTFNDGNAGAQGIGGALSASGQTTVMISDVPTLTAATVNGTSLVLSYDEVLDAGNAPASGAFAVIVNGAGRGVSAVAVSGNTVTLTLASAVANGETVSVSYTDPTAGNDINAIQDAAGNDAASLSAQAVTNTTPGVDITAPTLQSATVDDGTITLTYNEALDPAHQPAASFFSATANGLNRAVENVSIQGNSVYISLIAGVSQGDAVTVSYTNPSAGNDLHAVQDAAGNDAGSLTGQAVSNATVGTAAITKVVSASFTESTNATVSFTFNETMQATNTGNLALYKNGTGDNILTGAQGIVGGTVTFTTNATLGATDYVVMSYYGGGDLRDMSDNYVSQNTLVIGGSGVNAIDLENLDWSKYTTPITIRSNGGADVVTGSYNNDTLNGGGGSDTLAGGWGADRYNLSESTRASDTVVAAADRDSSGSQPYFHDTVYAFDVSGTATNDKLNLPSGSIAADASHVDGTDVGSLAQHSISGGILTFENSGGTTLLIDAGNLTAATDYLEANITTAGTTVGFAYDRDGNGYADSLFVFQNQGGSDLDNDTLILLMGVNGVTLGNSAGQNVVQIVDTSGPTIVDADFSANALNLYFSETVASVDFAGITLQKGNGASLTALTPIGAALTGSVATVTLNAANLTGNDYVLITPSDRAHQSGTDGFGNTSLIFAADETGFALGGTGDTVIDLSGLTGNYGIYDPDGGNDTLTGNAGSNDIEGGAGNDSLSGGAGEDDLAGGTGADNLDGGADADEFSFTQGESTPVSYNAGTYTFTGGADVITGGFTTMATNNNPDTGDRVHLRSAMPGNGMSSMTTPADHLATDQHYFLERGNYSGGAFTLDAVGADTLVVYDGDSATGAVSQTALVIQGVNPTQLTATDWGTIYLSGGVADTTAPVFQRATVDGASMVIDYNEVLSSTLPGTGAFVVMVDGIARGISDVSRSQTGESLFLTLVSPVNAGQTVTLTYTDPTAGDDVNATQDLAGNDAASLNAQAVTNLAGGGDGDYTYIYGDPGIGQPRVTEVRLQSDINSHRSDAILVEYVYLDQSVLVTGTPQLQLVIGTAGDMHTVLADYDAAHSSGNRLAFNYTLQAGDVGQMSVGNLYFPAGSSITNLAGTQSAFARIDNTGNNQAGTWLYGAATTTGTAANDWVAVPAGTDVSDAAKLTTALSGLDAGSGGDRDMLVFNLKYDGGTLSETPIANGLQFDIDSRVIRLLNESGTVNLYEVVGGTPQLIKTLHTGGAGFERMMMVLTDPAGTPLGPDYVADLQLVKGTYTDLIRNNQMNLGSDFTDSITLPADPSAFQMVWPGDGDDIVIGSNNGDHSDVSDGNDSISLGGGNDHFGWWGTGSSTLDGGTGEDTLTLSGGIATTLTGDITQMLQANGKVYLYAGATEFAIIEQGGASDTWQYRITSSSMDGFHDMVVTLKDIEYFQVGTQSDYLYLPLNGALFDVIAPYNTGANFGGNQITVTFNEAVTGSSGLSLSLNPGDANGWQGTPIMVTGVTGLGSNAITFTTSSTFASTDVVRLQYNASWGDLRDLAGNPLPTGEIWFGDNGTGATVIDLDWYTPWNGGTVLLRGNGGGDRLVGTAFNDVLIDGGGPDSLTGSWGADIIRLVENGGTIPYSKDVVKVSLGESYGFFQGVDTSETTMDAVTGSLTSPSGTGFDISSATIASHDVLDLTAKLIATNVSHADGIDVGVIAKHSITSGIVTLEDAGGTAILINEGNVQQAAVYAALNFNTPGLTGAFKMDTDGDGIVDSLVVVQDHGSSPLLGIDLPDTALLLHNLIGIESVTLGTTAGANVVQIQDTQAPEPVAMALTSDGLRFNFAENTFVPATVANLALTLQKNGAGAALAPSSVDGNGTTDMTLHYAVTLTPEDWAMMHYAGTGTADGISDANGNALIEDAGGFGFAEGGSGNNTIDLSALSAGYDLNGNAGDDTLIGSSGDDWLSGGTGADTLTGGAGVDDFTFEQGDSPLAVFQENGGAGVGNGDTFSFAGGVDRITDLASGEGIDLNKAMSDLLGDACAPQYMGATPANGLVTDQGYFTVQGNYVAGIFTVSDTGADTLLVWDGDSTSAVTQTATVLSGVQAAQLGLGTGYIHLQATSGFSNADDTYTLPAPAVLGQTVDALGGNDTLLMSFYPNHIIPDGDGLYFGNVLDLASIGTDDIVYTLDNQSANNYLLTGYHDVLAAQPVADYGINLQNFEHLRFDDGIDMLDINLASDIGLIDGSNTVGVLDGSSLAAGYLFASYDAGAAVTQVIGGASLADTVGLSFGIVSGEIQMNKDESGANPVWRFMEGVDEVFTITESGSDWAVDYGYNGAGTDLTLSGIEYAAVFNNLDDSILLRLSFMNLEPTVIV